MTTAAETRTEKKDVIGNIQQTLGTPQEKHFAKKEPLLKCTIGQITSNLSLTQYYDDASQSYRDPEPAYSFYFMERVRDQSGAMSNKITSIPIPKDSESIRALGEHLIKVAKALEGIRRRARHKGSRQLREDLSLQHIRYRAQQVRIVPLSLRCRS